MTPCSSWLPVMTFSRWNAKKKMPRSPTVGAIKKSRVPEMETSKKTQ